MDDGLNRRVAGGSAARAGGPTVVFCIDVQDDPVDDGRVGGVVRRRAHQVLTGFRICRARVGGPPPGPKTTEGMR